MELQSKIAFALLSLSVVLVSLSVCDPLQKTLQNVGGKIATAGDSVHAAASERHDIRARGQ